MFAYLQNIIERWNTWGIEAPFPALISGLLVALLFSIISTTAILILSDWAAQKLDSWK